MLHFITDIGTLQTHASQIRKNMIEMVGRVKGAHLGGGLSVVEILVALYFAIINIDPKNPNKEDRDRLIFSKGHCASVLYATLTERGFAPKSVLFDYYANGKLLMGHPVRGALSGIEVTTGSLGHGLAMGTGMAYAAKFDKKAFRSFVVMSDGECDEGSTWESILFAGHHKLDNLVAVVDYNKIQGFGNTREVLDLEPFAAKWEAFKWKVKVADGHNFSELLAVLKTIPFESGHPSVVIAHTVKGKGWAGFENTLASHYEAPDQKGGY